VLVLAGRFCICILEQTLKLFLILGLQLWFY
jgi:hypothetical protein